MSIFVWCYSLLGLKMAWDWSVHSSSTHLSVLIMIWLTGPALLIFWWVWMIITRTFKLLHGIISGDWIGGKE